MLILLLPWKLCLTSSFSVQHTQFMVDSRRTIILDIRVPSLPVAELGGHLGCVNATAWAPHSSCHICTAGDDSQALIWDLSAMPKPVEDPILAYNADGEINNLQWSASQPDWVSIAFNDKLQIRKYSFMRGVLCDEIPTCLYLTPPLCLLLSMALSPSMMKQSIV